MPLPPVNRDQWVFFVVFALLSLLGCSQQQPGDVSRPVPQAQTGAQTGSESPEIRSTTTVLAVISDQERPGGLEASAGHAGTSSDPGQSALFKVVFSTHGGGVAYIAQKGNASYVVHNGKPGRSYQAVIDHLTISPDGRRVAYSVRQNDRRRMVVDGNEGMGFEDVWLPAFSPDSRHITYIAQKNGKSHIVVDDRISAEGYDSYNDNPVFSGDSSRVIYIISGEYGKARIVVSDLALRTLGAREVLREPIVMDKAKMRIAAVGVLNGKQRIVEVGVEKPDAVTEGPLYDSIGYAAFGKDGKTLSYIAEKGKKHMVVMDGKEGLLPAGELREPPVIRPDNKVAGILLAAGDGFYLHQAFVRDGAKRTKFQEAAGLVYSEDSRQHAYIARREKRVFMVLNEKEGPSFDMIVTPMFSPDGKFLVYRARKDGKRFVVVADAQGGTVSRHPAYEQVFQPVFTADGTSVAYGVKDGNKLIWKVEKL